MSDIYQQLGIVRWMTNQPTTVPQTNLMIVIEPSVAHDEKADQLLTAMLKAINLAREEMIITDAEQIQKAPPRFALVFGEAAAQKLLGTKESLESLRSKLHLVGEQHTAVVATYHPSHLLLHPADKKNAYSDLLLLASKLK